MTVREQWDGGEWQLHCCRLLGIKHGEDVQFVPDRVGGDGGMEAYRLDDGVVYQCYAPEDAFTTTAETEAQKAKIRTDLHKLVSKADETMGILGQEYRIRRWVLLTPAYDDKELVRYARTKSKKIRDGDPRPVWCHDDFQVVVMTDLELFPVEIATLNGMSAGSIRLEVPEPDEDDAVASVGQTIADTLRQKLEVSPDLARDSELLDGYLTETLLDYVYGKSQLEVLQDRYGLAYESVIRRARSTFRTITRRLASSDGGPSDLNQLQQQLTDSLSRDVPALAPIACEDLARHYIAAWLIQCPLRLRAAA